jgi:hypothetical protein
MSLASASEANPAVGVKAMVAWNVTSVSLLPGHRPNLRFANELNDGVDMSMDDFHRTTRCSTSTVA